MEKFEQGVSEALGSVVTRENSLIAVKKAIARIASPSIRRGLLTLQNYALNAGIRCRELSGWAGILPHFIIIGTQRGGTTFLYDEITRHPCVVSALTKEVHFFDANFRKGTTWYQAFFPRCSVVHQRYGGNMITGEASPSYLFHPHAARRMFATVPQAKILVLLRNPVNRAYSHFHHEVRLGFETLPFADAIERENERLFGEMEKMLADDTYDSFNYMHYSYLTRGVYVDQVRVWRRFFPNEQILLLKSEDLYKDTATVMRQIIAFLELPAWRHERWGRPKAFPYPKMDAKTRKYLMNYFKPRNQRLYEYSGVDFGWNR